jgi:hypothetical protein
MSLMRAVRCAAVALLAGAGVAWGQGVSFDTQGDVRWSKYNYTDLTDDYSGEDAWVEFKLNGWLDRDRRLGLYLNALPVHASEDIFWWQRNITWGVGVQYWPIAAASEPWRGLRLYAWTGWRDFYDAPEGAVEPEDQDVQAGFDYYYDNLDAATTGVDSAWVLTPMVWMNNGYRKTNFSLDDYDGFLSSGNIKVGPRYDGFFPTYVYPYALLDWTWSPSYEERWWENFARVGAGVAVYPVARLAAPGGGGLVNGLLGRVRIYAEVLQQAAWLGDEAPDSVEDTDYRIGIAFSTGSFVGRP